MGSLGTPPGLKAMCEKHPSREAVARCGRCRFAFCETCLTRPHGTRNGPYCTRCSLALWGLAGRER